MAARGQPEKKSSQEPISKRSRAKWTRGVTQGVQHFASVKLWQTSDPPPQKMAKMINSFMLRAFYKEK
jgi:hypothetical protein